MPTYSVGFLLIALASAVAATNRRRLGLPMLVVTGIGLAIMFS